jgi:hypothetical protein
MYSFPGVAALRFQHNEHHGYISESPITAAVEQVFETVGDNVQFYKGVLSGARQGASGHDRNS